MKKLTNNLDCDGKHYTMCPKCFCGGFTKQIGKLPIKIKVTDEEVDKIRSSKVNVPETPTYDQIAKEKQ